MAEKNKKIFSLAAANTLVPLVADFTAEAVRQLDSIRQKYNVDFSCQDSSIPEPVLLEVEQTLLRWADRVTELGAYPKGYFTVDFQSVDPELLYCWTLGEETIAYTHRIWENFNHRRPLVESSNQPEDHLKWVN
jgi:hypothetical protein